MATKCLFKILDKIHLFPQRWQQNWKLESFHLNDDQVSFQKTLPNLFISTDVTLELKIGRLSPGWQPSVFSKYSSKFICFHKGHKKLKIGKLLPEWRPSAFSKYSIKFIYFHKGHKRNENWKSFTWMATKCLFKKLDQIYLFPQKSQKNWILEGFHLVCPAAGRAKLLNGGERNHRSSYGDAKERTSSQLSFIQRTLPKVINLGSVKLSIKCLTYWAVS